jgi:hypothetical protein
MGSGDAARGDRPSREERARRRANLGSLEAMASLRLKASGTRTPPSVGATWIGSGSRQRWGLATNAGEADEPIGTGGKDGLRACHKQRTGSSIGLEEVAIAHQSFDSPPGVAAGDAWAEAPAGFTGLGAIADLLPEDGLHAEHARASPCPVLGGQGLYPTNLLTEQVGESARIEMFEPGWMGEGERDFFGHRTVGAEKVSRAEGDQFMPIQVRGPRRGTDPLGCGLDQVVLDRVGNGIGGLCQHVVGSCELDNGCLLAGPEVLPATEATVLIFGQELVEAFEEFGKTALVVDDPAMPMVAAGNKEHNADARARGRVAQTVEKGVGGIGIGTEENPSLSASAGDHVAGTRYDWARQRHGRSSATAQVGCCPRSRIFVRNSDTRPTFLYSSVMRRSDLGAVAAEHAER